MHSSDMAGFEQPTGQHLRQRFGRRISRLRESLKRTDIDTLLLMSDENRYYFSGFTGKDGGFDESAGALLITRNRLIVATDGRYESQAREETDQYEVVRYTRSLADELPCLLKDLDSANLGFEGGRMPYALYSKIRERLIADASPVVLEDIDDLLTEARIEKDDYELDCIRQALALAENCFESFIHDDLAPGMSEKQAAWILEKKMRQAGAEALSFSIIAAFGDNSALPHAVCGDRKLKKDQPLLFDWGVVSKGYCSDISRSFVFGKADDTYRKIHNIVYTAQQKAIQSIKPGVNAGAVDRIAREHIEQSGFPSAFVHGLGHGVGLAIHESPRVSSQSTAVLKEGMVFTVEPGIYLPGWGGIRLENMVVVSADGVEVLNRLDSSVMEVV